MLTNFILSIVLVANIFFLSFLRKRRSPLNRAFALVILGIIIWTLSVYLWPFFSNKNILYIIGIVAYWGPLISAYNLLKFSYLFPDNDKSGSVLMRYFFLSLFVLAFLITLIPGFVLKDVGSYGYELKTGMGVYLLFMCIALLILVTIINLIKKYRELSGIYKYQIKYFFLGFLITVFIAFISNAVFALLNIYEYIWLGPSVTLIFTAFVTYSISNYRLMGIMLIISKLYLYTALASFTYFSFYLIYFAEEKLLDGVFSLKSLSFGFFIAIFFSYVFMKLINYIQKSSDVIFFKGYNPRRILKDIILKITTVINLEELIKILGQEFKRILEIEKMDVLFFPNNEGVEKKYTQNSNIFKKFKLSVEGPIYQKIAKNNKVIIRDELGEGDGDLIKTLDIYNIKIITPLISRYRLIGVIILGEKTNQNVYTQEDIEFLEIMTNQAATAIENARLYKKVDDFSKTLQKRVDEQTADIRQKAARMQKLLTMRSEFLDIASHQLRTPISVIKGVLSMLDEGSVPDDKKKQFLDSALAKSYKLEEVVDEILRASEMDSDKFEIDPTEVNLGEILSQIFIDKKVLADEKGIDLKFNLPKVIPNILSDERYIKHAIRNLINNSLQYTKKGSIVLTVRVKKDLLEIEVKDTGIGIPKKDLPKLFKKFSRAKNAVDAYTDGSGLGLFIIKKIMDAHPGGQVHIKETAINKGTTISIVLPVAK